MGVELKLQQSLGDINLLLKSNEYASILVDILNQIDLLSTIEIIESAILNFVETDMDTPTFITSCEHIVICLEKIYKLLLKIVNELNVHKTRYFYKWRSPQYSEYVQQLKKERHRLSKRVKLYLSLSLYRL